MAMVYVPKNSGEIKICMDFVQFDKVTKKTHTVLQTKGLQQELAGKKFFLSVANYVSFHHVFQLYFYLVFVVKRDL